MPNPASPPEASPACARPIIVHSYEHCLLALAAATDFGVPVALQSAPDAVFYAGPLYLKDMFDAAADTCPDAQACFILDCGDDEASLLMALRCGHRFLRISRDTPDALRLATTAGMWGARLLPESAAESLDLLDLEAPGESLARWLQAKAA